MRLARFCFHLSQVQPWAYQYRRLVLDPARAVRCEAGVLMGLLAGAAGRGLAPHLRGVMGPWYLAGFDPYGDVAAASRTALQDTFPGHKLRGALVLTRCVPSD